MKKSTTKSIIISAILVIAFCASLAAGATYAIFTSESQTNIAVTSGNVDVVATLSNLWVYSPTTISITDSSITDKENAATVIKEGVSGKFVNGGTATLNNDKGTVTLDKMTPGDKVTFTVTVTNKSNVDVQYRTVIKKVEPTDEGLFSALEFDIGGITPEYYSEWQFLSAATATDGDTIKAYDCSVELPSTVSGDDYENKACTIAIIVEVVQGNASNATATTITETANSAKEVVLTDSADDENAATIKAVIPAGSTSTDVTELTLVKTPTKVPGNIEIITGNTAVSTDVKIIDQKGDKVTATGDTFFTITLQLDKNLTILNFYHTGTKLAAVASLADLNAGDRYYYDVDTGKLTYTTQDFSVFTAVIKYAGGLGTEAAPYLISDAEQLKAAMENEDKVYLKLANDIALLNVVTEEQRKSSGQVRQTTIDSNIKLDLNGKTISVDASNADKYGEATPVLFTVTGENGLLTINDSSNSQTGTITCEVDGAQVYGVSVEKNAKLIVNAGNFYGGCTFAQVTTPGTIEINGGFYDLATTAKKVVPGYARYIINCIDRFYEQDKTIIIKGGTIVGYDPSDDPEGAGTTYVADGYTVISETQTDGERYTVVKGKTIKVSNETELLSALSEDCDEYGYKHILFTDNITVANSSENPYTEELYVTGGEEVVINLNAKTLTIPQCFTFNGSTADKVTIKNGTLVSNNLMQGGYNILAWDAERTDLTLNGVTVKYADTVTPTNAPISNNESAARININNSTIEGQISIGGGLATVNIKNTTLEAIAVGNSSKEHVINIYEGTVMTNTASLFTIHASKATVNIYGGTFTVADDDKQIFATLASEVKESSTVNIYGGTFNDQAMSYYYSDSTAFQDVIATDEKETDYTQTYKLSAIKEKEKDKVIGYKLTRVYSEITDTSGSTSGSTSDTSGSTSGSTSDTSGSTSDNT